MLLQWQQQEQAKALQQSPYRPCFPHGSPGPPYTIAMQQAQAQALSSTSQRRPPQPGRVISSVSLDGDTSIRGRLEAPSHRRSRSQEQGTEGVLGMRSLPAPNQLPPEKTPPLTLPSADQFLSNLTVTPGGTPEGASQASNVPLLKPPLHRKAGSSNQLHEVPVSLFASHTTPFPDSDDDEGGADSPRSVVGQSSATVARQPSQVVPRAAAEVDSTAGIARQPSQGPSNAAVHTFPSNAAVHTVPSNPAEHLLQRLTSDLAQVTASRQQLLAELTKVRNDRDSAWKSLAAFTETVKTSTAEAVVVMQLEHELQVARQTGQEAAANLRRAEERLKEQETRVASLEESVSQDRAGLEDAIARNSGLEAVVDEVSRKLREVEAERDMYLRQYKAAQQQGTEDEAAALRAALAARNEDLAEAASERDSARKALAEAKAEVERLSACLSVAQGTSLSQGPPGDRDPIRISLSRGTPGHRSGSLGTILDRQQIAARVAEQDLAANDRLRQLIAGGGGPERGDRGAAVAELQRALLEKTRAHEDARSQAEALRAAKEAAMVNLNSLVKDLDDTKEQVRRLQVVEQELEVLRQQCEDSKPSEVRSSTVTVTLLRASRREGDGWRR